MKIYLSSGDDFKQALLVTNITSVKVKFDMGKQMRLNRKCDRKVLAIQEAKYWPSTGAGNVTAGQILPIFQIMPLWQPATDKKTLPPPLHLQKRQYVCK